MPNACPKPCGRLATATVFISVSIVQLIAGLILLYSKYVYLLSAPNIWTAASNFAVGSLFGVSAGVWKSTSKPSTKYATRRKVLGSLAVSAIIMNGTTAAILILGEGNTLLSIHLENHSRHAPTTMASELLAYAYATSICSPIVCTVTAIVYLSGIWFHKSEEYSLKTMPQSKKRTVAEMDSDAFNWVYRKEQRRHSLPKPDLEILRKLAFETSSSFSLDSTSSAYFPIRSNSLSSVKDLDTPLSSQIRKIRASGGSLIPRLTRQRSAHPEMYGREEGTPASGNRAACHDNSMKSEKIRFTARSPLKERNMEFDIQRSPLKYKINKRGGVLVLGQGEHRRESGGWPRVNLKKNFKRGPLPDAVLHQKEVMEEGATFRNLDHSHTKLPRVAQQEQLCLSPISKGSRNQCDVVADVHCTEHLREHEAPLPISDGVVSSSDERFIENLSCKEHAYLCRTSTEASLNSTLGIPAVEISTRSDRPSEFYDRSRIRKTFSGESSHASVLSSQANDCSGASSLFDQSFPNLESGMSAEVGEVVPVQVNTVQRRKLPPKLIPVSIPVVSNVKKHAEVSTLNREKIAEGINKFSNERKAGFSSFRCDVSNASKMMNRSKSAKKHSEKHMDKILEQSLPMDSDFNMPPGESQMTASPAHTSGYISVIEENGEHAKQDLYNSRVFSQTPPSSSYLNGSTGENHSPRKKFRASQRKILDGVRTSSDEDRVNEIVEQLMGENSDSQKETLVQLFYDFVFQKVMEQETEI